MTFSLPPFLRPKVPVEPKPLSLAERLETMMTRNKRILLLDDNHLLRQMIVENAKHFNVDVTQAVTSGEARRLIETSEAFDAAVLDVAVTNGNGVSLYRWIVEKFPRLPVVFLTGYANPALEREIHAIGSAPIYTKPAVMSGGFFDDFLTKLGARRRVLG